MSEKPTIVIGRKLPEAVEARLARDYDARLNPDDRLYSTEELLELLEGADGVLPCHTEHFSAQVMERLPKSLRIIANMSVGVDHVDSEPGRTAHDSDRDRARNRLQLAAAHSGNRALASGRGLVHGLPGKTRFT